MKIAYYDSNGDPLVVKIVYRKGLIASGYSLKLSKKESNKAVFYKDGDNLNPEDDIYMLPKPVDDNDGRIHTNDLLKKLLLISYHFWNPNRMIRSIYMFLIFVMFASCAKLPIESITLTDAIIGEGKRMHDINLNLINNMFKEKREKIDLFIKNEYTPMLLKEFQMRVPGGTEYEAEFPNMIQSLVPKIVSRRDTMQSALEDQRIKLVTKLNDDYKTFEDASSKLKQLIQSGVRLNEERRLAFEQISSLTKNRINLNQIESELDKFILKSGDTGGKIDELNNSINLLLNN